MEEIEDVHYNPKEGEDFVMSHVSPMIVTFCKIEGPYIGDRLHFSNPSVRQHPAVLRYIYFTYLPLYCNIDLKI